jgi:hypothetical protein
MKIIKEYLPQPKRPDTKLKWGYLRNKGVYCLIEKLLSGKLVNQVSNNCGVSKITNAIAHIRKFIGYENIVNVRIDGLRCDSYKLVRTPRNIRKMTELREIIKSRIKEPVRRKR